jgi:hypothetical protein
MEHMERTKPTHVPGKQVQANSVASFAKNEFALFRGARRIACIFFI